MQWTIVQEPTTQTPQVGVSLHKQAWENMSEEEKEETERKKREGSKQGQQYVSNTDGARQARKEAVALPLRTVRCRRRR